MKKAILDRIEQFVAPFYAAKDEMHGLEHARRLAAGAPALAENDEVDRDLLLFGAYFHGIISTEESAIQTFLSSLDMESERTARILRVARESGKEGLPETKEGAYLHDAHLIEGGRVFGLAKCLITGAQRGQTIEQTLDFIERNLLGRFRCVTPNAQAVYEEREHFLRTSVAELRRNLAKAERHAPPSESNVHIRRAGPNDISTLHRLQVEWAEEHTAYGFVPMHEDGIRAALGPYCLVAEQDGEIVGFVSGTARISRDMTIMPDGDAYIEIDDICVVPRLRGRRIGSRLLERILAAARANGITKAMVYSSAKDIRPVMRFYEQHGFKSWFVQMSADLR